MKVMSNLLLAGVVAVMAMAFSAASSEAAARKKTCTASTCSTQCKGNTCQVMNCSDGQLSTPVLTRVCTQPDCPTKC